MFRKRNPKYYCLNPISSGCFQCLSEFASLWMEIEAFKRPRDTVPHCPLTPVRSPLPVCSHYHSDLGHPKDTPHHITTSHHNTTSQHHTTLHARGGIKNDVANLQIKKIYPPKASPSCATNRASSTKSGTLSHMSSVATDLRRLPWEWR